MLENVLLPTLVVEPDSRVRELAVDLISQVGLEARLDHCPAELSGGERQRVALARALIRQPPLLLCDEPTGNLDRDSAEAVSSLLFELHERLETILVVVTHNLTLANRCALRYRLRDQHLEEMAPLQPES